MSDPEAPRKEGQDDAGPGPDLTRVSCPPAAAGEDAPGDAGADDERTAFVAPGGGGAHGGEDVTRISASPAPSEAGAGAAQAAPRVPMLSAGTVINNNYRIVGVLSSGGMGSVYRGVEIGTGDPVAIKAILPDLAADPRAGALFRSEARMLRQLADDAIVRYYNYVHDHALDRYFLVMEFIEGITLSDHMARSGPLPPAAAEALIRRLAGALARAHAYGVIHRDLSPDNVMLPGGAVAEARLIDFGIARSARLSEDEAPGTFAGKLKYVAPEQLGHFGGHVGPETDIYGLALLLGAALSGRALPMGNSIEEAAERRQRVPDLSGVSPALRPLLTHMLEPDPAARPASMDEVLRLIEHPHLLPPRYGGPSAAVPGGLTLPPGLGRPGAARATRAEPQPEPAPEPPRDRAALRLIGGLGAVFLALLGAAGWYGWSAGLIGPSQGPQAGIEARLPPRQEAGRTGFLAAWDGGPCSYLTRVETGPRAGVVERYGRGGAAEGKGKDNAALAAAYEARFGSRPAVLERPVSEAQCAVLDFARSLQARPGPLPVLSATPEQVASGAEVRAAVAAPGPARVWVALVAPDGAVYDLTDRIGPDGSLRFGLSLPEGAPAAPQLLLAVAATRPLAAAATAADGTPAAQLLPALLEEIAGRGGGAGAALAHLQLLPPGSAEDG
ncbi:serine/threonine-protein kinase [Rhodovulum sp. MB263]|uniref:serine/threonine-protein kinase n=1 Tax=Rhodovulum sp. (strain MB263) TaxID=308754 RepID=UPI0009B7C187|nr:serine/threonine-protein kinase [Rhodovulum sp. MB263]ARC90750.1 hypothetical protein B5V46_18915 [Rhodovulum sp. MB263]